MDMVIKACDDDGIGGARAAVQVSMIWLHIIKSRIVEVE